MRYYPVFLDLQGQSCLVVGGGAVAWRKAQALVAAGARVTAVSPEVVRPLQALSRQRRLRWVPRCFKSCDLEQAFLVVAATDDQQINRRVSRSAQRLGCLVNVVDQPALCSFIVPSVMQRGALTIAISTSGASPALSKWIRRDVAKRYGPRFARVLNRMASWRPQVHRQTAGPAARKRRLETLLARELHRAGIRS